MENNFIAKLLLVVLLTLILRIGKSEASPDVLTDTEARSDNKIDNPFLRAPYQVCSQNAKGILKRVEVIPCDGTDFCPLVKGTNVTLDAEFISNIPSNKLIGSIYGKMSAFWPIRFGQPEDLCQSNQVECPLVPGKVYRYQTTVFVKNSYPRIKLHTKVLLEGDNHQEIACALIPVEIVSAPPIK